MKLKRYFFYYRRFGMSGIHYLKALESGKEVKVQLEGLSEPLSIKTVMEAEAFHQIFAKNPKYKKITLL